MLGSSSTSGYCSDLKWYDADGLCSPDRWDNLPEAALQMVVVAKGLGVEDAAKLLSGNMQPKS